MYARRLVVFALALCTGWLVAACGDHSSSGSNSSGSDAGTGIDACGSGTVVVGGVCLPDLSCAEGTEQRGNQCVATDSTTCGANTREVDGACVPAESICGDGATLMGNQCVPNDVVVCGSGTTEVAGECVVTDEPVECGPGTTLDDETNTCERNCTGSMVWNLIGERCESACGSGTALDEDMGVCLPSCPEGDYYDAIAESCESLPTCGGELEFDENMVCTGWALGDDSLDSVCARGAIHFCDTVFGCCDSFSDGFDGPAGDWAECVATLTLDCEQGLQFGTLRRLVEEGWLTVNEEGLADFEAAYLRPYDNCEAEHSRDLPGPTGWLNLKGIVPLPTEARIGSAFDGTGLADEDCLSLRYGADTCADGFSCVFIDTDVYHCLATLEQGLECEPRALDEPRCADGFLCLTVPVDGGETSDQCQPIAAEDDECVVDMGWWPCEEGLYCVEGEFLGDGYDANKRYCRPPVELGEPCSDADGASCAGSGRLRCGDVGEGEPDYRCVRADNTDNSCSTDFGCQHHPEDEPLRCFGIGEERSCHPQLDRDETCEVPSVRYSSLRGGCGPDDWCDPAGDEDEALGSCEQAAQLNEACAPPQCTGLGHDSCAELLQCELVPLDDGENGYRCIEGIAICLFDQQAELAGCPE